jgi:pimeloyl-ACP methyl ester carboxylesterase
MRYDPPDGNQKRLVVEMETRSGINLEVQDTGGAKPPLLFLHAEEYFEQHALFLQRLEETWRLIVPRHPGFGRSELSRDFRSVDDLAFLYLDLMDQLGLEHPVVVGASFGGWIALEMAVRCPERIDHLVLIGPAGVKFGTRYERGFADIYQMANDEVRRLTFADPDRWAPDYRAMTEEQLASVARDRQSTVHYAWRPYMHNPGLRKWLHRVRMPTLVACGGQDGVISPQSARALADALPNARLAVIDKAGHYPQIEQVDAVLRAIHDFGI